MFSTEWIEMSNGPRDTNKSTEEKMESALRFGVKLDLKRKKGEEEEVFIARVACRLDQLTRRR